MSFFFIFDSKPDTKKTQLIVLVIDSNPDKKKDPIHFLSLMQNHYSFSNPDKQTLFFFIIDTNKKALFIFIIDAKQDKQTLFIFHLF